MDDAPAAKQQDSKHAEVEEIKLDIASVDDAPAAKQQDSKPAEVEEVKLDIASVDDAPAAKQQNSKPAEIEEVKPDLVSLDESLKLKEESEQDEKDEVEEIPNEEVNDTENEDLISNETSDSDTKQDSEETPAEEDKSQDIAEEQQEGQVGELKILQEEEQVSDLANNDVNVVEVPSEDKEEQPANMSVVSGVSISDDDTTAAVLDEIAREKEQGSKVAESTASKLFEELENTYKSGDSVGKSLDNDIDLGDQSDNEDEFLKTFTTSVEEVFLDQPTAIISDYVPPSEDNNVHTTSPNGTESGIKRAKPSDIKTVPLVPEVMGQEIHSSPYVESATAKVRTVSAIVNLFKWLFLILILAIMGVLLLSGLAVMGIVPERLSPIHTVIYSLQKSPQENNNTVDEDLEPEIIENNQADISNPQEEYIQPNDVTEKVKNYTFSNGTTLQTRINSVHQNLSDEIEWSAFPTEEQDVYSIAVKIPQNKDGQGFSYRFNYNVASNMLTPTTSEAKNIIENY